MKENKTLNKGETVVLTMIDVGVWHDYEQKIDLIYSPDDKGYYFTHSNGKSSQIFNTKAKAENEFDNGFVEWTA